MGENMKKLPNIFKPNINNKLENNKEVYYSFFENTDSKREGDNKVINSFLSNNTIYSKKYLIKTSDKQYTTEIMSRVGNNIILKNGKAISIDNIISIEEI